MSLSTLLQALVLVVPLLVAVAYFTLAERQLMSAIQRRRGPDSVGAFGLLQPLADGLKLLVKETVLPTAASRGLFIFSPVLSFALAMVGWACLPFGQGQVIADMDLSALFLFAVSSLGVYGIILAGWSSNSKYAFLGAMRSAAQMVSYEVSIGFILVAVLLCAGSLNFTKVVVAQAESCWYIFPLFPMFLLFGVSARAETNRHPFDLPEAEAELVSGYNVEYSAMGFALFFLGEYSNMLVMCALMTILFLGGWSVAPVNLGMDLVSVGGPMVFAMKASFFVAFYVWARAAYPRYRYDQLMRMGWKVFLPASLGWVVLTAGLLSVGGDYMVFAENYSLVA